MIPLSTLLTYVRELVSLTGPSGHEEDVVRYLVTALEGLADEVTVDPLGNVIAKKNGA